MAIDFDSDLGVFFDLNGHAVELIVGPVGAERTVVGFFDNAHFSVGDGYGGSSTTQPMITCPTSDVASIPQNERVVVDGVEYRFHDHQPDGTGVSIVTLHKE